MQSLALVIKDIRDVDELQEDCLAILDKLLLHNLDLMFNQHLSNLISCCVFGAARCDNWLQTSGMSLGLDRGNAKFQKST